MVGFRDFNLCFTSERPQVRAYYQSRYVGRVEETTILNCCCFSKSVLRQPRSTRNSRSIGPMTRWPSE